MHIITLKYSYYNKMFSFLNVTHNNFKRKFHIYFLNCRFLLLYAEIILNLKYCNKKESNAQLKKIVEVITFVAFSFAYDEF